MLKKTTDRPIEEEYFIMIKPALPPTFMPRPQDTRAALKAADAVLGQCAAALTPHQLGAFNGAVARTIAPATVDTPARRAATPKQGKGGPQAA
jgi:hypothetical protein